MKRIIEDIAIGFMGALLFGIVAVVAYLGYQHSQFTPTAPKPERDALTLIITTPEGEDVRIFGSECNWQNSTHTELVCFAGWSYSPCENCPDQWYPIHNNEVVFWGKAIAWRVEK